MKCKVFLIAILLTPTLSFASGQLSCNKEQEVRDGMGSTQSCIYNGTLSQAFRAFGAQIELWKSLMYSGLPHEDYQQNFDDIEIVVNWRGYGQVEVTACKTETDYCANATFKKIGNKVLINAHFT